MADVLKQAIEVVGKIWDTVVKYKDNNEGLGDLRYTVSSLTDDLKSVQCHAAIMEDLGEDTAMKRLMDTLQNTQREVEESKNTAALVGFFGTNGIAKRLDGWRRNLFSRMLAAVLVNSTRTGLVVQDVNHKMDIIRHTLWSILQKLDTNPPAGQNAASTGLTNHSWSDLDLGKELNETEASERSLGDQSHFVATTSSTKGHLMLPSGSLTITHREDPMCWQMFSGTSSSSFPECAVLVKVYWLEVTGEVPRGDLSPGSYTVYLVFKLATHTKGLNGHLTSLLKYGQSESVERTSKVSVHPAGGSRDAEVAYPVNRNDDWMEVKLAEFVTDALPLYETAVRVGFCEHDTNNLKSGIIIARMEFRANN